MVLPTRFWITAGAAVAVFGVFAVFVLAGRADAGTDRAVANVGLLGFAVFAAVCAAVAATLGGGRKRAAWACLTIAATGWVVGQAIWTYFDLRADVGPVPFPSPADGGYVILQVFACLGLILFAVGHSGRLRLRLLLDGLIVSGSLFVVSWVLVLRPLFEAGAASRSAMALSVFYPVADVVTLTVAVLVLARAHTGQRGALTLLTAGVMMLASSDAVYVYLIAHDAYSSGGFTDVGWAAAGLLFGIAALVSWHGPHNDPQVAAVPTLVAMSLPYLPVLAAAIVGTAELLTSATTDPLLATALMLLVTVMLARQFIVMADNRRLLAEVADQALRDPLTGLANRGLFHDRLTHAVTLQRREPRSVAVLMLDLDDFKSVNDRLGHFVGDALLNQVAERLLGCTRRGDTVARLGGDEFSILVEGGPDHASFVAQRVVEAFDAPFFVDGHHLAVRPSVGLAAAPAADIEMSAETLLKQADIAMYSAKRTGTGHVHTFAADMHLGHSHPAVDAGGGVAAKPQVIEPPRGDAVTDGHVPLRRAGRITANGPRRAPTGPPAPRPAVINGHRTEPPPSMYELNSGERQHRKSRAHRLLQLVLLAVIAGFLVTTVPGVRAVAGYSWWMDGIWQSLACVAAAGLCVARIPHSSPDRAAWRIVAAGLASFALAKAYYMWFVRPLEQPPAPSLADMLWWGFYVCVFGALLMLVRSRAGRLSLSLALDAVVVGLGAATVAAALVLSTVVAGPQGNLAQAATNLAYPVLDLLLLAVLGGAVSLFRWHPPAALWWLIVGLTVFMVVDSSYLIQAARGGYTPGDYHDALWLVAIVIVALAPGWRGRPAIALVSPTWLPLAAPLVGGAIAVIVLIAAGYTSVTPVARYLAAVTLVVALGRLAVAFREERRTAEHAHAAQADDLTPLLNRRGFYQRAAALLPPRGPGAAGQRPCALLLLDLDNFKDVNDSLGHAAGDELLRIVAARLADPLREQDFLVRLGGDEFAVLLPEASANHALQAAAGLIAALDNPVELDGVQVHTGASIGIALSPEHGRDIGSLLRYSEIAMYRAKRSHIRYLIYTPEPGGRENTRAAMELLAQLRRAIEQRELAVHYQPKLNLYSGAIVGVEALVRWRHPEHGLLYPEQFLPLVRQHALMPALTELVVERALQDAARWHAQGHPIAVAVNLFPPTLADLDLPARIARTLDRHALTPDTLTVEITEDFLRGNPERARTVLAGLRSLGVTIAIDDFGTGCSALSNLRELPIDEVKLDHTFIAPITTDPAAATIVRSVIELAHTLGLTTVAEGVENPDTAAVLAIYGCDVAQGSHYSPPMTIAELLHLLGGGPSGEGFSLRAAHARR